MDFLQNTMKILKVNYSHDTMKILNVNYLHMHDAREAKYKLKSEVITTVVSISDKSNNNDKES